MERSLFGRLPAEVRCMVYDLASTDAEPLVVCIDQDTLDCTQQYNSSLRQVCRLTRAEVEPPKDLIIHVHATSTVCWKTAAYTLRTWAQRSVTKQILNEVTSITVTVDVPEFDFPASPPIGRIGNFADQRSRRFLGRLFEGIQNLWPENKEGTLVLKFQHYNSLPSVELSLPICPSDLWNGDCGWQYWAQSAFADNAPVTLDPLQSTDCYYYLFSHTYLSRFTLLPLEVVEYDSLQHSMWAMQRLLGLG